ncbi:MAG: DNA-directed RNA polymerase subunit omega [Planctomycetota bacterium]|nr:DNA-directed RNA polymerase subunit omega [Planctomycetota bacterium]
MDRLTLVEEATKKIGSKFRLAVLIQKRVRELMRGAPRLIQYDSRDPVEVALQEIIQEKVSLVEPGEKKQPF